MPWQDVSELELETGGEEIATVYRLYVNSEAVLEAREGSEDNDGPFVTVSPLNATVENLEDLPRAIKELRRLSPGDITIQREITNGFELTDDETAYVQEHTDLNVCSHGVAAGGR